MREAAAKSAFEIGGRSGQTSCPTCDALAQAKGTVGGNVISQYDYVCDAIGSRDQIVRSGTMMSESRNDAYGYNDRNG